MKPHWVLVLLVVLLASAQYSVCVRCFAKFDLNSGRCYEELGEMEEENCCQNPNYGYRRGDGECVYCGPLTWSQWTPWSQCNTLCQEGVRTRSRKCHGSDQSACNKRTSKLEMMPCNGTCCNINPDWDRWIPWSPCSVTCGGVGVRSRKKFCPSAEECRLSCKDPTEETENCLALNPCPVHGSWSRWSPWSDCSGSCIDDTPVPVRHSERSCSSPAASTDTIPPGNVCPGESRKEQQCSELPNCPVDGNWGAWSPFVEPCSVTCGKGLQLSNRVCDSPAPKYGGKYCEGLNSQTTLCFREPCPVDGFWTGWSSWSECSSSCITEGQVPVRTRLRSCTNPAPSLQPPGQQCKEGPTQKEDCGSLLHCAVDGQWGAWSTFSSCSVSCGVGRSFSFRQCDNPAPKYNGRTCPGERERSEICSTDVPCPVNGVWSEWSRWGDCVYPLRRARVIHCQPIVGQQYRDRRCLHRAYNGSLCPGEQGDNQLCYSVHRCLITGKWEGWEEWRLCNPMCGENSERMRRRHCEPDYSEYRKKKGNKTVTFFGHPTLDCPVREDTIENEKCHNAPPCS